MERAALNGMLVFFSPVSNEAVNTLLSIIDQAIKN